jgi:hypothetical protein
MTDKLSDEDLVWSLDKNEIEVIYWTCKGKSASATGKIISKSKSTVQTYRTLAYKKLQIDDLLKNDKIVELEKRFCKIVLDIIKTPDDLATYEERREKYFSKQKDILKAEPEEIEIFETPIIYESPPQPLIREPIPSPLPHPITSPPAPPPPPPVEKINIPVEEDRERAGRNFFWVSIITASCIGLTLIIFIGSRLVSQNLSPLSLLFNLTPTPSRTPNYVYVTMQAERTLEAQTILNVPLNTSTPITTPSFSRYNTQTAKTIQAGLTLTSVPTPIPTDTPVPIKLPFDDEFTKNYDPRWKVLAGDPIVVNGSLTVNGDNGAWLYLGDSSWTDYVVSLSIKYSGGGFGVAVRIQDPNNFIYFRFKSGEGWAWYIVQDGNYTMVPSTNTMYSIDYINSLLISVKGNEFTATKQQSQRSSYFILPDKYAAKFFSGGVALYIEPGTNIDYFRVNASNHNSTNMTAAPTNTSLSTISNTPFPIPFEDEFNKNDIDPRWSLISGNPITSNGILTGDKTGTVWMFVGNDGWQDYVVKADEKYFRGYGYFSVAVRIQDENNFLAFKVDMLTGDSTGWYIVENGNWDLVPETNFYTEFYEDNVLTITIRGNEITAVLNKGSSSFILPNNLESKFIKGGAGLYFDPGIEVDFFRVSGL